MRTRAAILAAAAGLQVGCYNYLPLRRSGVVPSSHLAVTLSESGSEDLARYLGPNALVVTGRYLGATDRGLTLSVESVESRRGDIAHWAGETIVVPSEYIREVAQREVSRPKTVLLAGAALLGFVLTYQAFGPGTSGDIPAAGGRPGAH
jgi:hypothetical protein